MTIAFIGKKKEGGQDYLASKIVSSNIAKIDWMVWDVPSDLDKYQSVQVSFYLNRPNTNAYIYKTKLEEGEISTLY